MWKFFLAVALLFSVCSVSACDVAKMTSLSELSRPYTGVYECERLTFGGRERTDEFDYLRLELDTDDEFTLTYRMAEGAEGSLGGKYTADPVRGFLTLTAKGKSRTFRMERGAILMDGNFLGKLFYAEFRLP